MTAASEVLFNQSSSVAPVGLIATESAVELGQKIDNYLLNSARKVG